MPCIVGCFALLFPRIALIILAIINLKYLDDAYQTVLWPVLGFFFAPLTTLAYAWAWHYGSGNVNGLALAVVVIAAIMDLGMLGGGASHKKVKKYYVVKRRSH